MPKLNPVPVGDDGIEGQLALAAASRKRLEGSVALITGAGSAGDILGTGAAIAILFAMHGAQIAIVDMDQARADFTLRHVERVGGRGIIHIADVCDPSAARRAVDVTTEAFGGLNILVNNVGVVRKGAAPNLARSDWDTALAINLSACLHFSQAAAPHLARDGGAIVNIGSIAGLRANGSTAYTVTKSALVGLTRDLAFNLGRDGVRVNLIAPGHIRAPMVTREDDAEYRARRVRAGLLPWEGTSWDVANAALFLASNEARWVTGAVLPVDAGAMTAMPLIKANDIVGKTGQ